MAIDYEDDPDMTFEIWAELQEWEELFGDDSIPEGCRACGGDYPNCADSCSMFD